MVPFNFFVLLSGVCFCLFLIGLHNFISNHETNKCEMTYMFEYPQYVRISFSGELGPKHLRYGLYAYGEGQFTEKLRKMSFSGIPVLFIPGNSGSYKQVRSLASVSLRKAISARSPYHFDFFAVDLNEEYSALYGGVLEDQTEFVRLSIERVLQLYARAPSPPKSVVLIGHSMGGMLARGLFLRADFDRHLVRVIVTLATPHRQPVLALDPYIARYYHEVNTYWDAHHATRLRHVTLVSVGGGHRDLQTTAVPGVWLSTDHLCSVWCKQLMLVVVRALFDLVDARTRQVSLSTADHHAAFHYHLVHRTAGKRLAGASHPPVSALDVRGDWRESLLRQYSAELREGVRAPTHLMVRLLADPGHQLLAVEAAGLQDRDWLFACRASAVVNHARACESGVNLSNWTEISPSVRFKRKFVFLNLTLLRQQPFTHVVLRVLPTDDPVQLNVDVHSSGRHITFEPPYWPLPFEHTVVEATDDSAVRYTIKLPGLGRAWQAYRLRLTPVQCKRATHHAVASFKVGWRREDSHVFVTDNASEVLQLRLHTPAPRDLDAGLSPRVELTLDPACKYSVRLSGSPADALGQLVRFYGPLLWAYVAGVLVLTAGHQLRCAGEHGRCVAFHSALVAGARPTRVLPPLLLAHQLLGVHVSETGEETVLSSGWRPGSWGPLAGRVPGLDAALLREQDLDWVLLPAALYAVAFSLAYLLGVGCWLAVVLGGHAAHKTTLRFVARTVVGSLCLSEWVLAALGKLPTAVACCLLTLCFSSCGALGLGVASSFFFLKLCKMYDDYLEELFKSSVKLILGRRKRGSEGVEGAAPAESEPLSQLHFSFTLLLLLAVLTSVNAPCVLTWAHNFRYSAQLQPDSSFLPSVVTCACLGVLWPASVPRPGLKHYAAVCRALYLLAGAMFLGAPVSLHRLSPLTAAVFALVTAHQALARADHRKRD
ncbi:GPI inositol-deacylase isoform X2 [Bacillus rossius redtenbacheri]|uniref:GPI inositol-deacylase isoform X2 n=1 Tax=Bacillus rossius redtenbacheri TaxID=93214 RepID=UPI002FDEC771